jgi:hypothetical protein
VGAQIGDTLDCSRGTFRNSSGRALSADRIKVKGTVSLQGGFQGEVRLLAAQIGADLNCAGSTVNEVDAENAAISGIFFWGDIKQPEASVLDLRNASAGSIIDDRNSWPKRGNLLLDGFVYQRFSGDVTPKDADTRLKWLALQDGFTPQPYCQLAKVLRETGDDDGARRVLYEMERRVHGQAGPGWFEAAWNRTWSWIAGQLSPVWRWVLKWSIGYGQYPSRALGLLVGMTIIGALLFHIGYTQGYMTPTDHAAYDYFKKLAGPPSYYEQFSSVVYSLENSVPLLKFGQDSAWTPNPAPQTWSRLPWWLTIPTLLRLLRRFQIISGWMLATLFVAGVSGIVRKE